jgi:hypothetical protein
MLPAVIYAKQKGIAWSSLPDFSADDAIRIADLEDAAGIALRTQTNAQSQRSVFDRVIMPVNMLIGSGDCTVHSAAEIGNPRASGHLLAKLKKSRSVEGEMEKEY